MAVIVRSVVFASLLAIVGCGGGGSGSEPAPPSSPPSSSPPPPATTSITGAAVKGPIADARVDVYRFDPSAPSLEGDLVTSGTTDGTAQIVDVEVEDDDAPFIVTFTSGPDTVDLSTGEAPVLTRLRTVLTGTVLAQERDIYATPLTTFALALASAKSDAGATPQTLLESLDDVVDEMRSSLVPGLSADVDIFATAPMITGDTTALEQQELAVEYRAAAEGLASIAVLLAQSAEGGVTADDVLARLASDLSDGIIDGSKNGDAIELPLEAIPATVADLTIPNDPEGRTVGDVIDVIVGERAATGFASVITDQLVGSGLAPASGGIHLDVDLDGDGTLNVLDDDIDGDGVANVDDLFPFDPSETADTDLDGIGDARDADIDGDLVHNDVELAAGYDPFDAADMSRDDDGDGFSNAEELNSGSDPEDASSRPGPGTLEFAQVNAVGAEGDTITVQVHRTLGAAGAVAVEYGSELTGSASSGDVAALPLGILSWDAGEIGAKTFDIEILEDDQIEPTETGRLVLRNVTGGARLGASQAMFTIIDGEGEEPNPGLLGISSFSQRVHEEAGELRVDVIRFGGSEGAVSVNVVAVASEGEIDVPAEAGTDFGEFEPADLRWDDGETGIRTARLPIHSDALAEGTERLIVDLVDVTGGAVVNFAESSVDIVDDDVNEPAGYVGFASRAHRVAEEEGAVDITLVRNYGNQGEVSVDFTQALSQSTATVGEDFIFTTDTVTWADGDDEPKVVTVPLVDNSTFEGEAAYFLPVLVNPVGGAVLDRPATFGNESWAVVVIFDYADVDLTVDSDGDGLVDVVDIDDDDDGVRDVEDADPLDPDVS